MEDTNTFENLDFLAQAFARNHYFRGKPLTAQDFQLEQEYFINKNRLMNCLIHGHGILYGLEVQLPISINNNSKKIKVKLSAGVAFDCYGREIVVTTTDANREKEVEETYQSDQKNYLYLKYKQSPKDPAAALVDESKCDEKTCTNAHIEETYELIVRMTPPASIISGKVQTEEKPILGAKVEALDSNQTVKAVAFADEKGKYELLVEIGEYNLRASAPGYESNTISDILTISDLSNPNDVKNFSLMTKSSSEPQLCKELTQEYYTDYLRFLPECNSPEVFLAVLVDDEEDPGQIKVHEDTVKYRSIIYNNPMLHELFCDHLNNFNNPHRTTAEQVRALQSINNVGNVDGQSYVSNINLISDNSILIDPQPINSQPDNKKITLKLAENAIRIINLNEEVINGLLTSDETITITPNSNDKTIQIRTNPGTIDDIKSVETERKEGESPKFARADHVHDLAENTVTRVTHLNDDITGLITSSDKSIIFKVGTNKTIDLSTNIATGVVSFSETTQRTTRFSRRIVPFPEQQQKTMDKVAIVMAVSRDLNPNLPVFMGDLDTLDTTLPLITAVYLPEQLFFRIILKDRRSVPNEDEFISIPINWIIRWWAIPAAKSQVTVVTALSNEISQTIITEPLLLRIALQPGVTLEELLSELGENGDRNTLREKLNVWKDAEIIRETRSRGSNRNNDKYFLREEAETEGGGGET